MSDLQNLTPANTYKALLQLDAGYTNGISGSTGANALQVSDGAGNNTSLALSTDRVGIGTTSPNEKLSVDGGVHVRSTNKIHFTNTTDQVYINSPSSNKFAIYTDDTSRMLFDDVGNVGLGTTSPSSKLDIVGDVSATQNIKTERSIEAGLDTTASATSVAVEARDARRVTAGSADPNQNWELYNNGTNSFIGILDRTYNTYLSDNSLDPNPSFRLVITNTDPNDPTDETGGRVGIGTLTPSAPLEVSSTTGGVILPRMNTSQRTAISASDGEMVYDTDLNKFYGYANGAWVALH